MLLHTYTQAWFTRDFLVLLPHVGGGAARSNPPVSLSSQKLMRHEVQERVEKGEDPLSPDLMLAVWYTCYTPESESAPKRMNAQPL